MKKTALIASLAVILLLFLAPLIGNSFMKKIINENIQRLESNGLVLKKSTDESGYLNTKEHFEFVLQNTEAFEHYLNSYTKTKIPSSLHKVLQGAIIAADIAYSNIPFSKAMTLEIYPLTLSETLMQEMKRNNPKAYKDFVHFLQSQGILYHIEYNLISDDFSGFIKDIDVEYDVKNQASLLMHLQGVRFFGKGDLLAPTRLEFNMHTLKFNVKDGANKLLLNVNNLRNTMYFESFSKYTSNITLFHAKLAMKSPQDDIALVIENLDTTSSSSVKNDKVNLRAKSFFERLEFHSNKTDLALKTFNSDIAINALEKQSYEKFSQLLAESKTMNKAILQEQMQNTLLSLLSHGLHVKVADLSLENITVKKIEELGGMKIQSDLTLKEDKDLVSKGQISPLLLLSDIELDMKIKLANALYLKLIEDSPMAPTIVSYAKKDADAVYFNILFRDTKLMINDKIVR